MSGEGPLKGIRVLEFTGLGPGPFCAMLLSDLGADVIAIDRAGKPPPGADIVTRRGRLHLPLDLKNADDRALCLDLVEHAEILIEGFRPGVMEKLGLGPDEAFARNSALVYGRMTGWGQIGPYADMAGHDINYIAITGALHAIGTAERPIPPVNLVGDFGGGALYLAMGVLAALLHARQTGKGQVVDAAISDGTASLMAMLYGYFGGGHWRDTREANRFDGGSHFYGTYRCADGEWIAIGAIEPQFYSELLRRLEIDDEAFADQLDSSRWPLLRERLAERIAERSRAEWCKLLEGTDVCFAPVLSMAEAPGHPHNRARETFVTHQGITQPAPAPRFSATPGRIQPREDGCEAVAARMSQWGVSPEKLKDR